ncbi:MAG: hypothetical protein WD768_17880 [Phycisphaeraceae bacterium]
MNTEAIIRDLPSPPTPRVRVEAVDGTIRIRFYLASTKTNISPVWGVIAFIVGAGLLGGLGEASEKGVAFWAGITLAGIGLPLIILGVVILTLHFYFELRLTDECVEIHVEKRAATRIPLEEIFAVRAEVVLAQDSKGRGAHLVLDTPHGSLRLLKQDSVEEVEYAALVLQTALSLPTVRHEAIPSVTASSGDLNFENRSQSLGCCVLGTWLLVAGAVIAFASGDIPTGLLLLPLALLLVWVSRRLRAHWPTREQEALARQYRVAIVKRNPVSDNPSESPFRKEPPTWRLVTLCILTAVGSAAIAYLLYGSVVNRAILHFFLSMIAMAALSVLMPASFRFFRWYSRRLCEWWGLPWQ